MPVTMPVTTLERDRATGKLSLNGVITVLRGGAYDVFFDPGRSPEFVRAGGRAHVVTRFGPGGAPCQLAADKATAATLESWDETGNDFSPFFGKMAGTGCNFLRVFLTGGTLRRSIGLVTLSPFVRRTVGAGVHYDVRGAVERGAWNLPFFRRLRAFVEQADRAGVVVQLSLFNYYDVVLDPRDNTRTWSLSPWNAQNVPDPDRAWADLHLIPNATAPANRHREFTTPPAGRATRLVQQKLIGRVMTAVAGLRNVVLEVMNEPRPVAGPADLARLAEFSSFVVGTIVGLRAATGSEALVSVNASFVLPEGDDPPGDSNMDVWARRTGSIPHYKDVDLVSYHGLTAMGDRGFNVCGGVRIPRMDAAAIDARADLHAAAHPDKALLFSTDAVNVKGFIHEYAGGVSMNVRDGQIRPVPGGTTLEAQLVRSEVYHWARRCFARGKGPFLGTIHFHNHSTFKLPLDRIGAAARHEGIQPAVAADVAEMAEMDAGLLDAV